MAFRYSSPPLTQGISSLVLIGLGLGLMATPGVQGLWSGWVEGTHALVHLVLAVFVLHALVFWGMSGFFWWVDRRGGPDWIVRHRIQSGPAREPETRRVAANLALNQLVVTPLMLVGLWKALEWRGWSVDTAFPGVFEVAWQMVALGGIAAIWFYATHRFLHRPWWMKKVHRVHHEFRTTRAWAAEYAHPVEMVFGNFGTLAIGVLILGPNLATLYIYTVVATHTFVAHHAGFAIPWMSWAVHHDWHHYRYKEAFGTFGILDRLLGTDEEFRALEDGQEVP